MSHITIPGRNVGREDRIIRGVLAACLLSMSAYGLVFNGISLIALLFLVSGGYSTWSAIAGRCFLYQRLAIDSRSEDQVAADDLAAERAAAAAQPTADAAPSVLIDLTQSAHTHSSDWGHPILGR